MSQLIGEFICKLDVKGRLMIPAALKKQLPEVEHQGLMINRGFEKHLTIYTKKEWDVVSADLAKLNTYERKSRDFVRYFLRGLTEVSVDAAGRILLPKSLVEYAGIKTDVVLSCQFDKIEVWDQAAYDTALDNEPENFAKLAEEVMGRRVIGE